MQTFGAFLAGLVAAGNLAAAMPSPSNNNQALSINVVHNKEFRPNGPLALAKAYNKYGAKMPSDLASAVARIEKDLGFQKRHSFGRFLKRNGTGDGTGSDPAKTPQGETPDLEYIAEVDIGTPPQKLYLDFDTGSSDLWVFSSETSQSQVNGHAIYDISKSSSAKQLDGATWQIQYGDQSSCSGSVYTDVVTVGGLTVKAQAVESAKTVSDQFTNGAKSMSGLLGLAMDQINTVSPQKQKTWFSNIKSQLKAPLFTANLKHAADGNYNFGYIDDSEHDGEISYTDVDSSKGFWGFTASGYAIGGGDLQSASVAGIADTGTTLLLLDDDIVSAYYQQVSGAKVDQNQGGYVFDCSSKLPDFSFGVGQSKITVPGSLINYAPTQEGSSSCFGGLQSSKDVGINIFGDIALKAALVVFDAGQNRLGWAPKKV